MSFKHWPPRHVAYSVMRMREGSEVRGLPPPLSWSKTFRPLAARKGWRKWPAASGSVPPEEQSLSHPAGHSRAMRAHAATLVPSVLASAGQEEHDTFVKDTDTKANVPTMSVDCVPSTPSLQVAGKQTLRRQTEDRQSRPTSQSNPSAQAVHSWHELLSSAPRHSPAR